MKNYRGLILGVILVLVGYFLATRFPAYLYKNQVLVCLLKEINQDPTLKDSSCLINAKTKALQSLTVDSIDHRHVLLNAPGELANDVDKDFCLSQLPQPWNNLASREDPRARQISYYTVLASLQQGVEVSGLEKCANYLPSSTYLDYLSYNDVALADGELSTLTREIAYQADHGWRNPLTRALNALKLGDEYLKSGEFDLASIAFRRVLESLSRIEQKDKLFYTSLAYRGLGAAAEQNEQFFESAEYYELGIIASSKTNHLLIPAYVRVLFADDHENPLLRMTAFIEDNQLGTPGFVFEVISTLAELSEIDSANKLLSLYRFPKSSHWLAANGIVARAQGDLSSAGSYFERAIESGETVDPSMKAGWATRLAATRVMHGDLMGGVEAQKLAISLTPERPNYWHDLSWFYQMDNQYGLALEAINRAIELSPDNNTFHDRKMQIIRQKTELPN